MLPTCIAFDFDSTLSRILGGLQGIFAIFIKRDVPKELVKECYEESKKDGGFNIQGLLEKIKLKTQKSFDDNVIFFEFDEWVKSSIALYPESISVISDLKKQKIPVAIVTRGDQSYQKRKIELTRVLYDELYIVSGESGKCKALRELMQKYGNPVLFIDDDPRDLDLIREHGISENEVTTILILRDDNHHQDAHSVHSHLKIKTLDEIPL